MAVLLCFSRLLLEIFGVTETTYDMALAYYKIVSLGCVFQGLSFVFCDFTRVSGKPVMGMMVTAVGAVTNIVLYAFFVAVAVWGSIISSMDYPNVWRWRRTFKNRSSGSEG